MRVILMLGLAILLCSCNEAKKYEMVSAGNEAYLLDHRTGKIIFLSENKGYEVVPSKNMEVDDPRTENLIERLKTISADSTAPAERVELADEILKIYNIRKLKLKSKKVVWVTEHDDKKSKSGQE